MGGILAVAGVEGLLANRAAFQDTQQSAADDWPAFWHAWWAAFRDRAVGVVSLYDLAVQQNLLDGVLGNAGVQSQQCRLGRALARMIDRVQGEFAVRSADRDHSRRQLYQLIRLSPPVSRQDVAESIGR